MRTSGKLQEEINACRPREVARLAETHDQWTGGPSQTIEHPHDSYSDAASFGSYGASGSHHSLPANSYGATAWPGGSGGGGGWRGVAFHWDGEPQGEGYTAEEGYAELGYTAQHGSDGWWREGGLHEGGASGREGYAAKEEEAKFDQVMQSFAHPGGGYIVGGYRVEEDCEGDYAATGYEEGYSEGEEAYGEEGQYRADEYYDTEHQDDGAFDRVRCFLIHSARGSTLEERSRQVP